MIPLQEAIRYRLQRIQRLIAFEDWVDYPQFATKTGLGRSSLIACILGLAWGFHFLLWMQCSLDLAGVLSLAPELKAWLSPDRLQMVWQWSAYVMALSTFHLLEFFITAIYNPTVADADSFLINHSTAYTAAALTSWAEFTVRFVFVPHWNSTWLSWFGFVVVILAQILRSLAMATARESFNHVIQTCRKENHVLVVHGIYRYLRHPSYVGFYYWSIGTQLLLNNVLHALAFAIASWHFFHRRIPFEEESLCRHFPDEYPAYVAQTWMGIPFLFSKVQLKEE